MFWLAPVPLRPGGRMAIGTVLPCLQWSCVSLGTRGSRAPSKCPLSWSQDGDGLCLGCGMDSVLSEQTMLCSLLTDCLYASGGDSLQIKLCWFLRYNQQRNSERGVKPHAAPPLSRKSVFSWRARKSGKQKSVSFEVSTYPHIESWYDFAGLHHPLFLLTLPVFFHAIKIGAGLFTTQQETGLSACLLCKALAYFCPL